jgi:hypothetical protein
LIERDGEKLTMSLPGIQTDCLDSVAFDVTSICLYAGGGGMERRNHQSVTLRELIAWSLPTGETRWHVVAKHKDRIADLAADPRGGELATKCSGEITIWSTAGQPLRTLESDFLAGPIVYSADGAQLIAPRENILKVRDSQSGEVVISVPLAKTTYTSAEAAAFVPGTLQMVVALSVINNRGQTSGKLMLVDLRTRAIRKTSNLDFEPEGIAIDPQGRWACIAGKRRGRGYMLFWSVLKWRPLADQGAHGASVDSLAVAPDGRQLATTGADHVIRIWDTSTWKTVVKLEEHRSDGAASAGIAWSPDGNYLAFATSGKPPEGGVFLYERAGQIWKLWQPLSPGASELAASPADLRPLQIFGPDVTMDTVGNFSLPANTWPTKCPQCTFPDLDAVPEPYVLSRGFAAAGDFSTAEVGNFLVRERARRVLEVAAAGACRFYPTVTAKTKEPTDWWLAVPQTRVTTAQLPEKYKKCPTCGEPKGVSRLEPIEFVPPEIDLFKSQQWTCSWVGEETPWYLKDYLKTTRDKLPKGQWTRLGIARELWFSTRLLLLMRECKLSGCYVHELANRKATAAEAEWIAERLEKLKASEPPRAIEPSGAATAQDAARWFRNYLAKHKSAKPLATRESVAAWEKKHGIKLPGDYRDFVTTIGRHTFHDMFGMEGFDVQIVGPSQLDAREYRRDPPDDSTEAAEPDGLLFATAINGDCLCFDLRGPAGNYPVFHFDHETMAFVPFAPDFVGAICRLVDRQ